MKKAIEYVQHRDKCVLNNRTKCSSPLEYDCLLWVRQQLQLHQQQLELAVGKWYHGFLHGNTVGSAGTGTLAVQRRSLLEEGLEAGWRCLSWPLRLLHQKESSQTYQGTCWEGIFGHIQDFPTRKEALVCCDILERAKTLR